MAVPLIVTEPDNAGMAAVLKFALGLSAETKCVSVCFSRCVNWYDVLAVRPSNSGLSCHEPVPLRYSALVTAVSVMLVVVLLAIVGAAGVVAVALATVAVAADVTLPVQLLAETLTFTVLPTSAAANTYVADVAPAIVVVPRRH